MSKRLSSISKDRPDIAQRDDVRDVASDIDRYGDLAGFTSSEAGQIIVAALTVDVASAMSTITSGYKTMPEIELRAVAATLETRIGLLRMLKNAATNLELAEAALAELIR